MDIKDKVLDVLNNSDEPLKGGQNCRNIWIR